MRRDIAARIKDVAIVRIIVRCWTHTSDGCIAAVEQDQQQRWRAPSMRWRSGAWRFGDVIPRTHDASAFDSDDDEGGAERVQGSTSPITKHDQYDIDWDDIDGAQRPAVEAARLLNTARQMVDTSRWWLMRCPRNATATGIARPVAGPSRAVKPRRTDPRSATQRQPEGGVSVSEGTATPPRERRHDISRVPTP